MKGPGESDLVRLLELIVANLLELHALKKIIFVRGIQL